MPPPHQLNDRQRHALMDAVALLSSVFWGPSRQSCGAMMQGNFLEPFHPLLPLLPAECLAALQEINDFIFTHADADCLYDTIEADYVRRFISDRGGISAPLYESCYTGTVRGGEAGPLMGEAAIAMRRRLESAGLALDENVAQMPDHLSVELEYLYFLIHGQIPGGDDLLKKKIRSFSGDAMLPWVREFRESRANDGCCAPVPSEGAVGSYSGVIAADVNAGAPFPNGAVSKARKVGHAPDEQSLCDHRRLRRHRRSGIPVEPFYPTAAANRAPHA